MRTYTLIALAAKAVGAKLDDANDCWVIQHADGIWRKWAPDTDDGDSLRMAVQLRKFPSVMKDGQGVTVGYEQKGRCFAPIIELFGEKDDASVVRLALLRAAAEVGKQLP